MALRCSAAVKAGVVEEFGRTQQFLWWQKEEVQREKTAEVAEQSGSPKTIAHQPCSLTEASGNLLSL